MWPGPSLPQGATPLALATEPAHLMPTMGCPLALLAPARVAVAGNQLVLVPESGGEGDIVEGFGGGVGTDDAFHVCVAGG